MGDRRSYRLCTAGERMSRHIKALNLARGLGADAVVNSKADPVDRVRLSPTGGGADIVFECAGRCGRSPIEQSGAQLVAGVEPYELISRRRQSARLAPPASSRRAAYQGQVRSENGKALMRHKVRGLLAWPIT